MSRSIIFSAIACVLALAVRPEVAAAALIPNGGFETGDFQVWRAYTPGGSAAITTTGADVYAGTYAAVLTRSDFSQIAILDKFNYGYALDSGKSYELSFAVKKLSGDSDAYLRTTFALWSGPTSGGIDVFANAPLTPGSQYGVVTYPFSIPAGSANVSVYMLFAVEDTSGAGSAAASYAIDHVDVTEVPGSPPPTLVPNGGFETGDLQVWRAHVPGGSAVVTANPTDVYERLHAAVVTRTDFSQAALLDKWGYHYHLDTGKRYEASWAMKKLSGDADAYLKISLVMFGPAPTYEPAIRVLDNQPFTPGSDYVVTTTESFEIPEGSASTDFYILFSPEDASGAGSAPASYAVDNVNVIEVPPPPPRGTVVLIG